MTPLLATVNCQQSLFESWDLMGPFPVCDEMFMGPIWAVQGSEDIVAGGKKNVRAKMGRCATGRCLLNMEDIARTNSLKV